MHSMTLCTDENLTQPKPTYFYIFKLETECCLENNLQEINGNFDMLEKLFWGAGMVCSKPNADIYFFRTRFYFH